MGCNELVVLVLAGSVPLFLLLAAVEIHVSGHILAAFVGHVDGRVVSQIHGARRAAVVVLRLTNRDIVRVSIGGHQAVRGVSIFARDIHVLVQEDIFTDTSPAKKNFVEYSSLIQEAGPFFRFLFFDIVLPPAHHFCLGGIQKKKSRPFYHNHTRDIYVAWPGHPFF